MFQLSCDLSHYVFMNARFSLNDAVDLELSQGTRVERLNKSDRFGAMIHQKKGFAILRLTLFTKGHLCLARFVLTCTRIACNVETTLSSQ